MTKTPSAGKKSVGPRGERAPRIGEELKAVLDGILDPVFVVSVEDGSILHCNGAAFRWQGRACEELLGKSFGILFDEQDPVRREALIERVRVHGHVFVEQTFVTRAGRRARADLSASMLRWSGGEGIFVTLRDAEERLAAQRLEVRMREAEVRLKTIEELSHEINNPLQAILLSLDAAPDSPLRPHVEAIAAVLRRMREGEAIPAPVPSSEAQPPAEPAARVAADSGRLLVADDSTAIRTTVRLMIESRFPGIAVDTAADGVEALEVFKRNHPAVMILDVVMPRATGDVVFRDIRAYCRQEGWEEPRILFCTGYTPPAGLGVELAAAPRHMCLLKPVAPSRLLDAVASLLAAAGAHAP